jgi:formylglycine-generating enzyme required for sulfatase activity
MPRLPDEQAIAEIRELVRRDELGKALDRLFEFDTYQSDASLLSWRFNHVRSQELKFLIRPEAANAEYANIAASILDLLDRVDEQLVQRSAVVLTSISVPETVLIPGGPFKVGITSQQLDLLVEEIFRGDYNIVDSPESRQNFRRQFQDEPPREVELPDFYIGKYLVTNEQFAQFVTERRHETDSERRGERRTWRSYSRPGHEKYPVVFVSWNDAMAYCGWLTEKTGQNYRLPTVEEWTKACRGPDGNLYPWGDEYDPSRCNTMESMRGFEMTEVGTFEDGQSSYGVYDLVGNVVEWTSSSDGAYRLVLGGSWRMACEIYGLPMLKRRAAPSLYTDDLGFRCARDA